MKYGMKDKADDSVLDELIGRCEAKMASPFKKEKPEAIIAVSEDEKESESEEGESEESMDPEMLAKLMEMYEELKG